MLLEELNNLGFNTWQKQTHNKQFEIVIAILGMIGGGILPFPELIGWGFVGFCDC